MIQIHFGGLFEIEDLATRRIYATHYGPNRAVLAARVHALENDEQRVAVARPEDPLQIVELFNCRLESLFHAPLFSDRWMCRRIRNAEAAIEWHKIICVRRFKHVLRPYLITSCPGFNKLMLLYGPVHVLVDEFVTGIAPGVQSIDDRGR